MDQQLIIQPVLGMLLLTAAVWLLMYARRLPFILGNHIDPQSIATPELLNAAIPAQINNPSNNLKNRFELPVLFYVLCVLLLLMQKVDQMFLFLAWTYVGLGVIHSLIHCSDLRIHINMQAVPNVSVQRLAACGPSAAPVVRRNCPHRKRPRTEFFDRSHHFA